MVSRIDTNEPVFGNPKTESVRNNFGHAKTEIEALQASTDAFIRRTGDQMTGALTLFGDPIQNFHATTRRWVQNLVSSTVNTLVYIGNYDAANDSILASNSPAFPAGSPLPAAAENNRQFYLTVDTTRNPPGIGNQPPGGVPAGSWIISNGDSWIVYLASAPNITSESVIIPAPIENVSGANVDAALRSVGQDFLLKSGGRVTGSLNLDLGTTVVNDQAVTKQWVENEISGREFLEEAPSDGYAYGRYQLGWTRVLPITGGRVTGKVYINQTQDLPVAAQDALSVFDTIIPGVGGSAGAGGIRYNTYLDGTDWRYLASGSVASVSNAAGFIIHTAPFGQAGNIVPWRTSLQIDEAGNINFHGDLLSVQDGWVRVTGPDAFELLAAPNQYARMVTTVEGVRTWFMGCSPNGHFSIADGNANANRLLIDLDGTVVFPVGLSTPILNANNGVWTVWTDHRFNWAYTPGTLHFSVDGISVATLPANSTRDNEKANVLPSNFDSLSVLREIPLFRYDIQEYQGSRRTIDCGFMSHGLKPHVASAIFNDFDGSGPGVVDLALIPHLVRSVQQMSQEISELKSRLQQLEAR